MTSPSPSAQSSTASGSDKTSTSRPTRTQQSAWGPPSQQPSVRRGLTPLATNNLPSLTLGSSSRRNPTSSSPAPNTSTTSPLTSTFSSVLASSNRLATSRNNSSTSSSASPFTPLQTGSQSQQPLPTSQPLSSPRSRAITPSSLASTGISISASQGGAGGAGGGGGPSRGAAFSPSLSGTNISSPTSFAFEKSASFTSGPSSATSGQSSLSKISVAQIFLLLDSITEKEGKAKWDSKADQIRKLVDSNGMEVFSKYFRRLVSGNAPQIFPGMNKNVENAGNYPLLVLEMEKVSQDPEQAQRIAESINTPDGDIFRDFDLSTFIDHFKLDPITKTALALAFESVGKPDLQTKADTFLSNVLPFFLQSLTQPGSNSDLTTSFIATTLERFIFNSPPNFDGECRAGLMYAVSLRYKNMNSDVPSEVSSALQMLSLSESQSNIVRLLQRNGPRSTSTIEAVNEIIQAAGPDALNEEQVANALLFLVLTQGWQQYSPSAFVSAVRSIAGAKNLNWQLVVRMFDREGLKVTTDQFLALYTALLPVAQDDDAFDIQALWGGKWDNGETQLSFLSTFLSTSPSQIDVSTIPHFRRAFSPELFSDALEEVRQQVEPALKSTLSSLDAVSALFDLVFYSQTTWASLESQTLFQNIVQHDLPVLLCSAFSVPKPWTATQQNFVLRSFIAFILKQHEGYQFALHGVWKQERQWCAEQLFHAFTQEPSCTTLILEHAEEHGWFDYLLGFTNGLSLDLASLAHRKGTFDMEQWVKNASQRTVLDMGSLLSKFLRIKAEDELRVQRKEQMAPAMVTLAVKTVYSLLLILEDYIGDHESLTPVQRICLQTYPRLINYGQGFDDIIEANGQDGNAIPEAIDKQMQDLFGKMYGNNISLRDMLELMQKYKSSRDSAEQDLFTCMVHGLIDEYHCYHEYPIEALTKTAVIFGAIIQHRLISGIPLKVGLGMILDAVREHDPHEPMFKFGVEAIEQFLGRLPEWAGFCNLLVQIPSLQGTTIYRRAEEILREQGHQLDNDGDANGLNGLTDGFNLTNGNIEELLSPDASTQKFRSLHIDHPLRPELYDDPHEEVQDKVLFVLNNVSEQNIGVKLQDLKDVLRNQHYQWFAKYLVEERAKLQPNFQQLYLDLLEMLGDKLLWAEVLRETYVSAIRMLNSESTLTSSTERTHLKNLGGWLGSLTIAKDKPIKHKNIYFKELLVEGYDTQRLVVVIPFTCKVLLQANKSTVFKPPNPWLMDIIALLLELYHFAELKLNLKFEIEVLCKDLELDHKSIEPSTSIRDRPSHLDDEIAGPTIPEGLEAFEDLSLAGINRGVRTERLSPATIMSSLPSLEHRLKLPPSSGSMIDSNHLLKIVQAAVDRAIAEIIAPVVERSITIASISTAQLIFKDFAMEPDENRVRDAAQNMVRALAGSLALVTCKEPLRMSVTNFIRIQLAEIPDQPMSEGQILMCVNDNLDVACDFVEKAAMDKGIPEIDRVIENQLEARRRHRAARPNEPYIDPGINRWAFFIPEPFRQSTGGLNKEQMAIYQEFARQSRPPGPNHVQNVSTDSGRQVADVLQGSFPTIPILSTPAEQPAIPHQPSQQHEPRMQPPPLSTSLAQPQMNGFMDTMNPQEKIQNLLSELQDAARQAPEEHLKDLARESSISQAFNQILRAILTAGNAEDMARVAAQGIYRTLYTQAEVPLEVELMVLLLVKICQFSPLVERSLIYDWIPNQDDDNIFNVPVTVALINAELMDLPRLDMMLTKCILQKKVASLELLSKLMDQVLFNEEPTALRADFASSLDAMNHWYAEDSSLAPAIEINRKLKESGIPEVINPYLSDKTRMKRDQMGYIFTEWVGIYSNSGATDRTYAAFLKEMHQKQVMNNQEDSALFFRLCIDTAVGAFDHEIQNPSGTANDAFMHTDALAKLVIMLVKFQGETNGAVKANKAIYLNSILSLIILVVNHHQVAYGDRFNQRVFFRLFSSILCEYSMNTLHRTNQHREMIFVFADKLLVLQPLHVPGFVYGWISLISHRVFMPGLLNMSDESGWEHYCQIMQVMLSYIGEQLKPATISHVAKDLYRGVLRILLILHHDFPEFLAENHFRLCNVIPAYCTQLRNLILSAYPSSFQVLPDPFSDGLKVERLDEVRKTPTIAGDFQAPLERNNVKGIIDSILRGSSFSDVSIMQIAEAVYNPVGKETGMFFQPVNVDFVLLNALVLYLAHDAISSNAQKEGPIFQSNSPHAALMEKLAKAFHPEGRYYFLSAIANQLRYPNSHTHYFSYTIIHLFGIGHADQQESDICQQITRVLMERLIVHRPHPWGLIITLLELFKNTGMMFWDLPFIKAAPEIRRLFSALSQHVQQQSPRSLA